MLPDGKDASSAFAFNRKFAQRATRSQTFAFNVSLTSEQHVHKRLLST
jgi:hypothetical protein